MEALTLKVKESRIPKQGYLFSLQPEGNLGDRITQVSNSTAEKAHGQGSQVTQQKGHPKGCCYWTTALQSISPWEKETHASPGADVLKHYGPIYPCPLEEEGPALQGPGFFFCIRVYFGAETTYKQT